MKIKAIGFDIGETLVNYNMPLSWSAYYKDAIKFMCKENDLSFSEDRFLKAKKVLEKYNTRINPREREVTSDDIFSEIFAEWKEDNNKIYETKRSFYKFFQRNAILYPDVKPLLEFCNNNNIRCAVYTNVAYGMDDEFSLKDIEEIENYIELKLTSRNVGYRKPNKIGFEIMLEKFNCNPKEMIYIGNEEKDIVGSNSAGMYSILINRDGEAKNYNQDFTVKNLLEVEEIVKTL